MFGFRFGFWFGNRGLVLGLAFVLEIGVWFRVCIFGLGIVVWFGVCIFGLGIVVLF